MENIRSINLGEGHPKIYVTGDTHGDIDWNKLTTRRFPPQQSLTKEDFVIILGDMGCIWGNDNRDKYIQKNYNDRNFTTLFIDGNHENHDALNSFPVETWNGGKIHRISDSIIHLMRGQVFTIGGKTFFTMGGAESTDRVYRTEGISWWASEMPSEEEYAEAMDNLQKHDFKVDYVLTHCAPEGALKIYRSSNKLTRFLDSLYSDEKFKYTRWYCGHYHMNYEYEDKDFTMLFSNLLRIM